MKDYRTETEKRLHDTISFALLVLTGKRIEKQKFMKAVGYLRDANKVLDNKENGCASGRHISECDCV